MQHKHNQDLMYYVLWVCLEDWEKKNYKKIISCKADKASKLEEYLTSAWSAFTITANRIY